MTIGEPIRPKQKSKNSFISLVERVMSVFFPFLLIVSLMAVLTESINELECNTNLTMMTRNKENLDGLWSNFIVID